MCDIEINIGNLPLLITFMVMLLRIYDGQVTFTISGSCEVPPIQHRRYYCAHEGLCRPGQGSFLWRCPVAHRDLAASKQKTSYSRPIGAESNKTLASPQNQAPSQSQTSTAVGIFYTSLKFVAWGLNLTEHSCATVTAF